MALIGLLSKPFGAVVTFNMGNGCNRTGDKAGFCATLSQTNKKMRHQPSRALITGSFHYGSTHNL
jgi:hypothetical protein